MADFVSGDFKVRQLGVWERAVAERPVEAWLYGCPSWLVCEEERYREDGGNFEEMFQGVRSRYFPHGDPRLMRAGGVTSSVTTSGDVTSLVTSNVRLCKTCLVTPVSGRTECDACRQRRSRGS